MEPAAGRRGHQVGWGTGYPGQFVPVAADGWKGIHQAKRVWVHGLLKELARRGAFNDLAGVHDGDIVRHLHQQG